MTVTLHGAGALIGPSQATRLAKRRLHLGPNGFAFLAATAEATATA